MSFGDNLRRIRIERGYHDSKIFAAILKIPYTTYRNYETRGSIPKEDTLIEIATVLSTSIDNLFGFKPKNKSKLDIVLSVMQDCGINFVHNEDLTEVEILVNDRPIALIPDTDMIDIVLQAEQFAMFEVGTLKRLFVKGYILDGIEQLSRTKSAFLATPIEEKVDKNGRKYRTRLSKKI